LRKHGEGDDRDKRFELTIFHDELVLIMHTFLASLIFNVRQFALSKSRRIQDAMLLASVSSIPVSPASQGVETRKSPQFSRDLMTHKKLQGECKRSSASETLHAKMVLVAQLLQAGQIYHHI
jgi:hypothetical protein